MGQEINWGALAADIDEAFKPVPAQEYEVRVASADGSKLSSNGKPQVKLQLEIMGGPHAGKKLFTSLTVSPESPKAMGMFFIQLEAMGIPRDWLINNGVGMEQLAAELVGRMATVKVSIDDKYDGTPRNKVDSIKKYQGGAPAPSGVPTPAVTAPAPAQQTEKTAIPSPSLPF